MGRLFQFPFIHMGTNLCGQTPTCEEWGKGVERNSHFQYLLWRSHCLYEGRGYQEKDVLFSSKSCHSLSVVAKRLKIMLLSYPSLPVVASYISVYVWSPWFSVIVPKHNQRKPLVSLRGDASLHKSQLYSGIGIDSQTLFSEISDIRNQELKEGLPLPK